MPLAQNSRDLRRAAVGAQRAAIEAQRAAADAQREAVRKQQEQLRLEPLVAPSPDPACDPISDNAVAPIIEGAAKSEQLGPALLRAVIRQESAFSPCAASEKGAKGLMQLMPEVIEQFAVKDPFEPKSSVDAGAKYRRN